jgi:hypothetical protein
MSEESFSKRKNRGESQQPRRGEISEGCCAACLRASAGACSERESRLGSRACEWRTENEAAASRENATQKSRRCETQREQIKERGTRSAHYSADAGEENTIERRKAARASAAARIKRQKNNGTLVPHGTQENKWWRAGGRNRCCQP